MKSLSARAIAGLIAATLIQGAAAMSTADAQEKRTDRWVMVAGHGSVEAPPDTGHIATGVVTEAVTAREALTTNNTAMRKVIEGFKAAGVAAKDIQTEQFQIQPRYKSYKDRSTHQIEAYVVRNRIQVTVRELARLGDILDQAVTLGANEGSGISFSVSDAERRKDEARKKAVENAMHRGRLLAEASGARLGRVLTITEEVVNPPQPRPMVTRSASAADSVPIESGSEMLSVRVEVSFALE
jgi:uncharacterized protein YggE